MFLSNESFESAPHNVAWDEACVEMAEAISLLNEERFGSDPGQDLPIRSRPAVSPIPSIEILRLWEFSSPTVVVGRASRLEQEVHLDRCERDSVPVLRRSSGGSTIVAGPGCLMYSVLISYVKRPHWKSLDVAHSEVMGLVKNAVQSTLDHFQIVKSVQLQGTCDLTIDDFKFSGNALRCKRFAMMYHGTLLLDMPPEWVTNYLKEPPRQPDYRARRTHESFVRNLLDRIDIDPRTFQGRLQLELAREWKATESWDQFPFNRELQDQFDRLLQNRYLLDSWHRERM